MHIYAFGSICRGEVLRDSDVDLLAIIDHQSDQFDADKFSIYSYARIKELWENGNPFAWHLFLESKMIYSSDQRNYLNGLGRPADYKTYVNDCEKFYELFQDAQSSLVIGTSSQVFDLSTVFLSIRNIATCFSLGISCRPSFARHSGLHLGADSISISMNSYHILERARILCTRGLGTAITQHEIENAIKELLDVDAWMSNLIEKARKHERIQ